MTLTEDVSGAVRAEVARAGRTAPDVARAVGMSYATWRRRMAKPEGWTVGELTRIAVELGIPVRQLLDGDAR